MDIEKAGADLAGAAPVLSEIRQDLADRHWEHPQRAQLADLAMQEIEAGIAKLSALGHRFHLIEGQGAAPVEFPKMLYRDDAEGKLQSQTVVNRAEQDRMLGEGWRLGPSRVGAVEGVEPLVAPGDPAPAGTPVGLQAPMPSEPPVDPDQASGGAPPNPAPGSGLPPDGAAGLGATNDRGGDMHSVVTDEQRERFDEAEQQTASHPAGSDEPHQA